MFPVSLSKTFNVFNTPINTYGQINTRRIATLLLNMYLFGKIDFGITTFFLIFLTRGAYKVGVYYFAANDIDLLNL